MKLDKHNNLIKLTVIVLLIAISILTVVFIARYFAVGTAKERLEENYISIVDFVGRNVTIKTSISRIVAIGPGVLRLVAYLNAVDLVVGVEEAEHQWSRIGRDYAMAYGDIFINLPVVGPGGPRSPPDPEKIRAVKPDLVLMSRAYVELYNPDRLAEEVGAPVVVIDYGEAGYLDIDAFKSTLRFLGKILNREDRAKELCSYIDQIVIDLRNRVIGIMSKPTVYVGAVSYKGRQPFTSSQIAFPPLTLIDTPSIVDSLDNRRGFISLDFEYILQKQPDVVFIDLNNLDVVLNDFNKDRQKFCSLNAFKNGRVYSILPYNYYHTNVATALVDAYYIGKTLYPERFSDIDPEQKADEIYKTFLGKEIYRMFLEGFGRGFSNLSDLFKCS
ncbi:MAG: ABC transporter substrate-binding protein [Ignisphaera sp.]